MKPTVAQRRVLEFIKYPGHLSSSHDLEGARYYFKGGGPRVHWNTGEALRSAGYIAAMPRQPNTPFWRTDFDITPAGRAAVPAPATRDLRRP